MSYKITIEDVNLYYGSFHALKEISLNIPEREITAFIGPSGCGKSTLLKSLNRMNDLVEGCKITGRIALDGMDVYAKTTDVNGLRKRVGMVFQKPNPFPMSIYDNIAYGPRTHGIRTRGKLDEIVETSLRQAAIWDEVKDRLNKKRAWHVGRPAAAFVHCPRACDQAGGAADGRADLSARPNFDRQDRRPCTRTQKRLYYCHGYA